MTEAWPTGIFGCCSVKDCGCSCCLYNLFTGPCIYCHALDRAEQGSCCQQCICTNFPCYNAIMRNRVAAKYDIPESMCTSLACVFCCPACSCLQVKNVILEKEGLTWACCSVELSTEAGAPATSISDEGGRQTKSTGDDGAFEDVELMEGERMSRE